MGGKAEVGRVAGGSGVGGGKQGKAGKNSEGITRPLPILPLGASDPTGKTLKWMISFMKQFHEPGDSRANVGELQ